MRQALGRGLDALISNQADKTPLGEGEKRPVTRIPISSIRPNRLQPRKHFDAERLSELAHSIKTYGLVQPILVSMDPVTKTFELIAGERRLKAAQLAGLKDIDAVIQTQLTDDRRLIIALIENLQREDLNPIEQALGYERLMKEFSINQTQLTDVVGKSKAAVSNALRLLALPEEVQKALQFGKITEGHARAMLMVKDHVELIQLFHIVVSSALSVREVEDRARLIQGGAKVQDRETPKKSPDIRAIEEDLQRTLGTKVSVKTRKDGTQGSIRIQFYGLEDFDRIIKIIKK